MQHEKNSEINEITSTSTDEGIEQKQKEGTSASESGSNSTKRARVFDLSAMFEETKKTAEMRSAEGEEKRKISEAEKAATRQEISTTATASTSSHSKPADGKSKSAGAGHSVNSSNAGTDEDEEDDFLPMLPPGFVPDRSVMTSADEESQDKKEDDDSDFEDGEGIPIVKLVPAACEAKLRHSNKPVSALRFEPIGQRFASGGLDYQLKIFDFQKMDMGLRPDKELSPSESHVINSVAFSSNGETLLVCSGQAQIRFLDRKGKQWAETVRGDQYLVDVSNTKGHTASVNCCMFNPLNKSEFLSCSDDGTLRLWHMDDYKELTRCFNKHRKVIKTKTAKGKRAMPQVCAYSPDGKLLAAGCDDGSIQVWKYGNLYVNTTFLAREAHRGPVTSFAFSPDSQKILSRGLDDTLKLWSMKDPKKPLFEVTGLENAWKSTDCGFSPRGELVFTGTSSPNAETPGKLVFYNSETFDLVYKMEFPGLTVMRIDWHARLNQILVGFNDGSIKIFYDQQLSDKGVMGCVSKPIKRSRASEVVREEMVLSPLTLEMFQPRGEEGEEKEVSGWRLKKYLRMRDNQMRPDFRKPADIPMDGPSANGRVAASGSTLHSYLAKQIGTEQNKAFLEDMDVRASILRHAEAAAADPQFIDKAYRKNQPKPIFQEKTTAPEDEEEDTELQPLFKMPRLG